MNDLPTQPPKLSIAYSATGDLAIELAKMLALVAPISMSVEQQELWLRAAIDALEDIRANEVSVISAEIRRSVTRPSQIVPAIAEKVAELRARRIRQAAPVLKLVEEVPQPPPPPLSETEIKNLSRDLVSMGLKCGALEYRAGKLIDTAA